MKEMPERIRKRHNFRDNEKYNRVLDQLYFKGMMPFEVASRIYPSTTVPYHDNVHDREVI